MGEFPRPREMDFSFLVGTWEVIDCGLETAKGDSQGVLGAIFELTKDGEVSWKLPENHIDIPVFSSDTYEAVARGPFLTTLIRFGSYKGHVIEFRIEKFNAETLTMTIHEGLLYMNCKKLTANLPDDCIMELPYTLLPAYEEGYFTDLSIIASDNREFKVHTCILKILAPDIDWRAQPTPFSGLPHHIISSVIHYLYTYSLPPDLTLEGAEELIITALNYPGLEDLITLCRTFIRNVTLAREMASLISDVHVLGIQATDQFAVTSDMYCIREPPILCSAVRNAIRDVAVAISKMLLFCDTYNKRKKEFSQKGGHEIIRFTKSRIPFFVSQVTTFMQVVKATFGSMTAPERHELACYLLPDMGYIFDTVITVLLRTQEFFETVLLRLGPEDNAKYRLKMHNFKEHMERINHKKEMSKIRFILHRVECLVHHLKKKRDRFRNLNSDNKVRSLTRNLDHLIDRLPFLFLRIEEMTEDLEQKCEWIESQFCFKMTTAKVGEFLSTLLENKEALQTLLSTLCDIIQRDDFTQAVIALGILDCPLNDFVNLSESADEDNGAEDHGFNLAQFLWEPPPPRVNALCKNALQRLIDGVETDMVFRIIPSDVPEDDDDDDYDNKSFGDFTDDEGSSVNGQGQANVDEDAKVEDASSTPFGAEDASSTDRGSDSEATANTQTKGACPNNTETKGAGSNLTGDSVTSADTKIDDGVSTTKHTDGTTHKSRKTEYEVAAGKSDGAIHAKRDEDGATSTGRSPDGARRRTREAEDDELPALTTDSGVRPKKRDEEGATSAGRSPDSARRRAREAEEEIPALMTDTGVRPKKRDEEGATSAGRSPDSARRRTREADEEIPALTTDSGVRPKIRDEEGATLTGRSPDAARRRAREAEDDELPALTTDSGVRPKRRDDEGATSTGRSTDGARRRAIEAEDDELPSLATDSAVRPRQGKAGAASTRKEEDGAACAIVEGATSIEKEEEEGAACAITEEAAISIEKEEEGAACAIAEEDGKGVVRGKSEEEEDDIIIVKAHRAVIATRCPLFKKALLSGMLEDINRMIDIHNISPKLFPIFLNYLYTGIMDYSNFTPRQITDMFLIADCYELEAFKEGCERALKMCIDDNSVLLFLNMADKYNAPILKEACKKYIREHPTVPLDNVLYDELPKKLKTEIHDLIVWGKDRVLLINSQESSGDGSDVAGACALADADSDTEAWDIPRVDIEDCVPSTDSMRFRWALEQLREIVGPGVPRTILVQVLLAADCDLNRALNYYYSSS